MDSGKIPPDAGKWKYYIRGIVMARKYEKVKTLLPAIRQLQVEGGTRKETAKKSGLQNERTGRSHCRDIISS